LEVEKGSGFASRIAPRYQIDVRIVPRIADGRIDEKPREPGHRDRDPVPASRHFLRDVQKPE
jgi:hypothetical protein